DTITHLLQLSSAAREILIVDQTPTHEPQTEAALERLHREKRIEWIRLGVPSITHAMNVGLQMSRSEIVLFLDDDIIPGDELALVHARSHAEHACKIVAGQVLQPGEHALSSAAGESEFVFRSS